MNIKFMYENKYMNINYDSPKIGLSFVYGIMCCRSFLFDTDVSFQEGNTACCIVLDFLHDDVIKWKHLPRY